MKALRWKRLPWVEVDVERCSGRVMMLGSRVPPSSLYGCFQAGDSIPSVADDFRVTVEEVEDAIRYFMHPRRKAFEVAASRRFTRYAKSPKAWWKVKSNEPKEIA